MTHLDLFSGIGGFAIAAQAAGFETIGFSEVEPYACRVLAKNFPIVPNYGDIHKLTGKPCDLITGGFPCQPFSHAGKRKGAADNRALWPEMRRVIAESKPRWVLGENVAGIIGMELDRVLSDLEGIGYSAWPVVIPACAVDAHHRRDRVWILAHRDSGGGSPEHGKQQAERPEIARASGEGTVADANGARLERRLCESVLECACERPAGSEGSSVSDDGCRGGEGAGREISGGSQPTWWQPEPGMGRVADGIPRRMDRLKGLGNAIVPQVACEILRAIASVIAVT